MSLLNHGDTILHLVKDQAYARKNIIIERRLHIPDYCAIGMTT